MSKNIINQPLEQRIDAYVQGKLTEDEVHALWVELMQKPAYIDQLQTEIDLARLHRSGRPQKKSLGYWKWISAAAAVVLLVGLVNTLVNTGQKLLNTAGKSSITPQETLSTTEVTRSPEKISLLDSLLNAGFQAAVADRSQQTITIYRQMAHRTENSITRSKARLNAGILLYTASKFGQSVRYFRKSLADTPATSLRRKQTFWYMGNAYINLKKGPAARRAIAKADAIGKLYETDEYAMLKQLDYLPGTRRRNPKSR